MAVLKPRTRLVNFRLSEEEFTSLKTACSVLGARSVSDFARSAVLRSVESQISQEGQLHRRLSQLDDKVGELDVMLRRLADALEPAPVAAPRVSEAG